MTINIKLKLDLSKIILLIACLILIFTGAVIAQDEDNKDRPFATVVNDEGGAVLLTGEMAYTNPFFTSGVASPIIILEDQAGFIDRNTAFLFPRESQTLGQITSDFYTSPFSYSLSLPIEPQGTLRDVDNNGEDNLGVMVFAIAYWTNTWGDPFLEIRDQSGGGWSTNGASTITSNNPDTPNEIIGGQFLIYAPNSLQGFPEGFGDDGLLFTEDDPIVDIPQGYSVVDLDSTPFTFNRAASQVVDLYESESSALVDFSNLSYSDAFDAMLDKLRREYAFTEEKNIDWDALSDEFRPRFVEAERNDDSNAYLNALREFLWRIPDGHVALSPFTPFAEQFQFDTAMGIGIAIRETTDGRALVTYLLEGAPAQQAGVELGAEITMINDTPITEFITNQQPWSQPFSTSHNLRLAQQRYATRFDGDTTSVNITYINPTERDPIAVELTPVNEVTSFYQSSSNNLDGFELPVEFEILDNGIGYVAIYSFSDNTVLSIQLWERMIRQFKNANVRGIILDLRQNGGGRGFLADQMSAYFFNDELVVGQRGYYNEELDDFFFDPANIQQLYLPPQDLRYNGDLAVLVGPSCASACERIAYNLTLEDRAEIVGYFPTAGLGGSVEDFRMPLGMTVRVTTGRSVNENGNVHIEGIGIAPTLTVPLDDMTLFSEGDPVLNYAEAVIMDTLPILDGGEIEIGETLTGTFIPNRRIQYTLELESTDTVDILLGNPVGDMATVLRFYDLDGNLIFSNEEQQTERGTNTFLPEISPNFDLTLVIEVATYNDSLEGQYFLRVVESE